MARVDLDIQGIIAASSSIEISSYIHLLSQQFFVFDVRYHGLCPTHP